MPTTFNVISLGNYASIDPTEGNTTAENASALVGLTFGGPGNALVNNFQSFSQGSSGYSGGNNTAYDQNNSASNDQFRLDGGPNQIFDASAVYNATITYLDGSTATITAVIFQDTAGNTYLAPEFSANADQSALEAAPIQSLTLDSLVGDNYSGMTGSRETWNFVPCFTEGVRIDTPDGDVAIEKLKVGDLVRTRDHGDQPIRWIGRVSCRAEGNLIPVRIAQGALGKALPERDLVVSPQHRILLASKIAKRMLGSAEVLVAARKLLPLPGVTLAQDLAEVTYIHLLFDRHEIIFAEGAPTESLLLAEQAQRALGAEELAELKTLFPELFTAKASPSRLQPKGRHAKRLVARHLKNQQPLLQL